MARIFFVQHKLFNIVNGSEPIPARSILPKVLDMCIRLANGLIPQANPIQKWSAEERSIWHWNCYHVLAYGLIMKSLTNDATAYFKVIDCKTVYDVWKTVTKKYGQSSNLILYILKAQISTLFKKKDTPMAEHVDTFSQLIEQINYHLKPEEKWSNERINRTFFGTLSLDK